MHDHAQCFAASRILRRRTVALWTFLLAIAWMGVSAAPLRAQASAPIDTAKLAMEAQSWLADLIRINTTNPPGNELPAAKYVAGVLQKEGINTEVFEITPGRGVAIARLQSGALPNPTNALLLVAHLDVVGVDATKWSADPFAATIRDGYLYGRGAIDDKGMLAANMAAMVALKRSGAKLNRDVIFLASADEEEGGAASIKTVIDKYWDKIACSFALNEGGRVRLQDGKVQYVAIQASEKVPYDVIVTATGTSGHASMPAPDNAVAHLAAAIAKIAAYQPPADPLTITRRYFEQLAPIEDDEIGKWMRALEQPERADLAVKHLSEDSPAWNSMLHDSIAPTMLNAGIRDNVVPSEATATLNIRLLPGHSIEELMAQFEKLVNDPEVKFKLAPDAGENARPSDLDTPLYQTIQRIAPQDFPGATTLPFLSTGATDSAELRLHKVEAYGLDPFPLSDDDDQRMHGDNERIPLDSFRQGVAFLYHVVSDFVIAR